VRVLRARVLLVRELQVLWLLRVVFLLLLALLPPLELWLLLGVCLLLPLLCPQELVLLVRQVLWFLSWLQGLPQDRCQVKALHNRGEV
jgi:hypothetical protein